MTRSFWPRRFSVAATLLALALGACGQPAELAVTPPAPGHPADECRAAGPPISVLFLSKQAVKDDADGLTYFVQDWGGHRGCFKGTVVTDLKGVNLAPFRVMIVDVSHDQRLSETDAQGMQQFVAAGKRVGLFAWPLQLADRTLLPDALGGARPILQNATFQIARGCGDWQFTEQAATEPFRLRGASYRYENFGSAIFTIHVTDPQRVWANTLFCPQDSGPMVVEVKAGIVAGFSVAYSISLSDNNVRATGMKEMLVDVIHSLAQPSGLN